MSHLPRRLAVDRVADHLVAEHPGDHPLRVGVDGITAAGKTTWAGELAAAVRARGRSAQHLTLDGFHQPRARRYRQGRTSAAGYYADAFDVEALVARVLEPLGPAGDRRIQTKVHDTETDLPLNPDPVTVPLDAVVLVDGTFLQRPQLDGCWDQVVYVDTEPAVAGARAAQRDAGLFGGREAVEHIYAVRYHPACALYADEVDPISRADIVLGNNDLGHPELCRIGGPAGADVALFAYGTLQQPGVQQATFGRLLSTRPDRLPGYDRGWVTITDPYVLATSGTARHPAVTPSGAPGSAVDGSVLTLTTEELAAADAYEVADYRRDRVRLVSGRAAWAYVAAHPERRALLTP